MIKSWKQLKSRMLIETKFFKLRSDQCEMPSGQVVPDYYVLDSCDWANVVALDEERRLILVRQFRYASLETFLEFPGGMCDGDEPQLAVERELLEETGYKAEQIIALGDHSPNPALFSNRLHSFLALGCSKVAEQSLDRHEEIEVLTMDIATLFKKVDEGEFAHSLMLASLMLARPYLLGERECSI